MTRYALIVVTLFGLGACGPAQPEHVKTPDEWLAEQEAEGAKLEAERKQQSVDAPTTTEDEKKRLWDDKQADLELRRASRSAETCPESVTEKSPKGRATVTITFTNDGNVKESSISEPYADTTVGTCVLRAMGNVIVPAYNGPEKTIQWEIDLTDAKNKTSGPVGGDKSE